MKFRNLAEWEQYLSKYLLRKSDLEGWGNVYNEINRVGGVHKQMTAADKLSW